MRTNVGTRVSSALYDKLKEFAEAQGLTIAEAVRQLLTQGLYGVNKEREHVKLQGDNGDTTKKGGNTMEDKDLLQVLKEIEGLKLKQVEDKHNVERSLSEMSRALEALRGDIASLRDIQEAKESELRSIRQGLLELSERVIDRSSLATSLEELCKSNPDNPLCRIAREEGRKAAKDIIEEAKPKGEVRIGHSSWEEVWACPECRQTLINHIFRYGVWEDVKRKAKEEGLLEEEKREDEKPKKAFF